jgi:hypothetical protein
VSVRSELRALRKLIADAGVAGDDDAAYAADYWRRLGEAAGRLEDACPADLRDAVVGRMLAATDVWEAAGFPGPMAGLFRLEPLWELVADQVGADTLPASLPREWVRVLLGHPDAVAHQHHCTDCGAPAPTSPCLQVRHTPRCLVCGGETGLLGWSHTCQRVAAAAGLADAARDAWVRQADPMTPFRERGWLPGQRLDDWLAGQGRGVPA